MKTIMFHVRPGGEGQDVLEQAASIIRNGGIVAFPTETVYGLAANALDENAVKRIFDAKNRPADDPLIVHGSSVAIIDTIANIPPGRVAAIETLATRFWPGPLTLVLPKSAAIPGIVTANLPTVAVRVPAHPVALAFIEACGVPVAAPSANRFEHASPTRAAHVLRDLDGRIDAIIDAGPSRIGVESTIVDMTRDPPVLLRPGGVPLEELREAIGPVELHPAVRNKNHDAVLIAPGMKARHYAPAARLILVEGKRPAVDREIERVATRCVSDGLATGIIVPGKIIEVPGAFTRHLGEDADDMARHLYDALREMDDRGMDVIIAGCTSEEGLGLAIMNRLRRAAKDVLQA